MVMRTTPRRRKAASPRRAARGATTPKRTTPRRKPTTLARTAAKAGRPRTRRPSAAAPKRPTAESLISRQISKMRTPPRTVAPEDVTAERRRPPAPQITGTRRLPPVGRTPTPKAQARVSPRTPIGPARVPMTGGSYGPVAYKSLPSREVATKRAATGAGRKAMAAQKTAQMRGATGNLPIPETRRSAKAFSPASVKARKKTIAAITERGSPGLLRKQYPKGLTGKPAPVGRTPAAPKATVSPRTPLPKAQQRKIEKQVEKKVQTAQNKVHAKEGTGKRMDKSGGFWHRHK